METVKLPVEVCREDALRNNSATFGKGQLEMQDGFLASLNAQQMDVLCFLVRESETVFLQQNSLEALRAWIDKALEFDLEELGLSESSYRNRLLAVLRKHSPDGYRDYVLNKFSPHGSRENDAYTLESVYKISWEEYQNHPSFAKFEAEEREREEENAERDRLLAAQKEEKRAYQEKKDMIARERHASLKKFFSQLLSPDDFECYEAGHLDEEIIFQAIERLLEMEINGLSEEHIKVTFIPKGQSVPSSERVVVYDGKTFKLLGWLEKGLEAVTERVNKLEGGDWVKVLLFHVERVKTGELVFVVGLEESMGIFYPSFRWQVKCEYTLG